MLSIVGLIEVQVLHSMVFNIILSHSQEQLPSYSGPEGYPPPTMGADGPFTTMEVRLMRQVSGFGFRIIGGEEEGSQVCYSSIVV